MGLWLPGDPWFEIQDDLSRPTVQLIDADSSERRKLCARQAGAYVASQVVGLTGSQVAAVIDRSVEGNFVPLSDGQVRQFNQEVADHEWIKTWHNVESKTAVPMAAREWPSSGASRRAIHRTIVRITDNMIKAGDIEHHNPVAALQDLLAAGVKGVVNVLPVMIKNIPQDLPLDGKCSLLIAMVKRDKRDKLTGLLHTLGSNTFWRICTKSTIEFSDQLWHVTPQLAGIKHVLAAELSSELRLPIAEVYFGQYGLQLAEAWSVLAHVLRFGRLRVRY